MIQKIEFVYSWVYDNMRRESSRIQEKLKSLKEEYPSSDEIKRMMKGYKQKWREEEKA